MDMEERFTYEVKKLTTENDWGNARLEGIGTSEIEQACGKSTFGSVNDLWQLKTGLVKPQPQNEDMKRGHELEPKVRDRFMHKYGAYFELEYHPYYMYYRSDYGMLFSTLDGILKARMDFVLQLPGCKPMTFHAGERAVLEIKNPKPRTASAYANWNNLPEHYLYQNAGQLFCTGIEKHVEIANLTGEYAQPDEQGMDLRYWVSQYGDYLTIMEEIRATIPKVWQDICNRQPVPTALNGAKNEVVVLSSKVELGQITENLEEVKASIQAYADQFKGLKFTESQYSEAKDFRKELNAQIKQIEDARKSIKKQWNEPLDAFEKKCKELSAIIEEVKTPIDKQIVEFDEREKAEKKKECDKLIELALQTLPENYQDIINKSGGIAFNDKWLNKTYKLSEVKKDIEGIINTENSNMQILFSAVMLNMDDNDCDAILNAFIKSGRNTAVAMNTKNDILRIREERARKEEEARAVEALRRAQMEAQRQQIVEEPGPTAGPTGPIPAQNRPVNQPSGPIQEPAPRKTVGGRLVMEVSHPDKAMFAKLSTWMTNNGFTFRRID